MDAMNKIRRQQEHDKEIKRAAVEETIHYMVINFIQYLGDKRGFKSDSIVQMCKYVISHAESISGGYTTLAEAEEDVKDRYGIVFKDGNIYKLEDSK